MVQKLDFMNQLASEATQYISTTLSLRLEPLAGVLSIDYLRIHIWQWINMEKRAFSKDLTLLHPISKNI